MREIDTIGIKLCDEQGELFEKSLEVKGLSSAMFVKRFMHSSLAAKFDNLSIINEIFIPDDVIEEYNKNEYKKRGTRYSKNTLFWMGYIYRYWAYTKEVSSRELYKLINPSILAKYYEIYHTLDPEKAIERIVESLPIDESDNAIAIDIYKRIIDNK